MVANAKLRHYTAEERERATARAMEVGYRAASVELGIPWGTLSCWVFKARKTVARTASAAPAAASPTMEASPAPASTAPAARSTARPRVAKVYTPSQIAQALERVAAIGVRPAAPAGTRSQN